MAIGDNLSTAKSAPIAEKKALAIRTDPSRDPILRESERILADYVNLVRQTPAAVLAAH